VTFSDDPLASELDSFVSSIAGSSYWAAAVGEYGVGATSVGTPVHLSESAPVTISTSDVDTWLQSRLDGTHSEWGTPDANTLYVLFYPATTTVTSAEGDSCQLFGGYHLETVLPSGLTVPYAVVVRCDSTPAGLPNGLDGQTAYGSHELAEAATDPHPLTHPAYLKEDDWAWGFAGEEVGDLCIAAVSPALRYVTPPDVGSLVQRLWSNHAALAGHNPCVPASSGDVYFNSVPMLDDYVQVPGKSPGTTTRAVQIPVGGTKTIEVKLFSDGPTDGAWAVSAIDFWAQPPVSAPTLALAFDKNVGKNGDVLHLTITVTNPAPKNSEYMPFILESTLGDRVTAWYGMVVVE
jgi:hypothetical protein